MPHTSPTPALSLGSTSLPFGNGCSADRPRTRRRLCTRDVELGFSARSRADHHAITHRLAAFESVPVTDGDHRRALDLQQLLAERRQHRALSLVDALVAAVAGARDLTVLHYDADFELVAELTGQAHEWVVARGVAD